MGVDLVTEVSSIIMAIAWSGVVMLYDFSMSKNNILNWWYWKINPQKKYGRKKKVKASFGRIFLFKALGGCPICFGLWFSFWVLLLPIDYFIFLGFSQLVLIHKYGS